MSNWHYSSEKLSAAITTLAKHPGAIGARLSAALPDLLASNLGGKMPNDETQTFHDRIQARLSHLQDLSVEEAQALVQDVLSLQSMLDYLRQA